MTMMSRSSAPSTSGWTSYSTKADFARTLRTFSSFASSFGMHGTGTCNLALPSVSGCGGSLTRAHSSSHSNGPIGMPPTIRPHFSHCAISSSAMFGFSHVCLYVRFSSSCPGGPWHCDVVPAWLPGPACVGRISSSAVGWISSSTISPVARALLGRFGAGSTLRNPERIAAVRINQNGFSCFT